MHSRREATGLEGLPQASPDAPLAHLPRHVAVIMDGNGRWARQRGLPRIAGHRAGVNNIRRAIEAFARAHVPTLTLYAFSTENWSRPDEEVQGLLGILQEVVHQEVQEMHRQGVRMLHLGRLDRLHPSVQREIREGVDMTRNNTRITVCFAFDYGGRAEILDAVRRIVEDGVPAKAIDEDMLGRYLYTAGLPDPDLVVRTGGEMRLSNFLLWQTAYAEYYSTPTFWPDFDEAELEKALRAYSQRERRFGGVGAGNGKAARLSQKPGR
ncbi:MAG: polyprenyl diphosphate synthase [Chloroflexota bacterium]